MDKTGKAATIIGTIANFALFLTKLFVGISSNSLSVYCDAINNLSDTFGCLIALLGFIFYKKMNDMQNERTQSLCTFVINIIIAVTGGYFVYNGLERVLYPLPVAYSAGYAYIIIATVFVKIAMGIMYSHFYKKDRSPIIKALITDSFLDCFVTICALMGLFLITKINFAADGIFAIITGATITVSAIKSIIEHAKFLING